MVGSLTSRLASEVEPSVEQHAIPTALPLAGRFRFGRLTTSIRTNDATFARRFVRIFHDCRIDEPGEAATELTVYVPPTGESVFARISGHDQLDEETARALLPGGGVRAFGDCLAVPRSGAWPMFFAHYFVHHVMALHRDVLFLHAATIDVGGRGVCLCGDKGAGKSTLAMALGARGHPVLGDEVAAVAIGRYECLPFRRAVSIREGPQAPGVRAFLDREPRDMERLPDGTTRWRIPLSTIFPDAKAGPVPLDTAIFLRGFGAQTQAEAIEFSSENAAWLGPLHATFRGRPTGLAAIEIARLFSRVRCYRVTISGAPAEMAERIEKLVECR